VVVAAAACWALTVAFRRKRKWCWSSDAGA
jgi:hypothetical protein